MSSVKRISKLILPLSVGLGLWLGLQILEAQKEKGQNSIRILSFEGTLPSEWVLSIERQLKTRIINDEVLSKSDWERAFKKQPYDFLSIFNFQVEQLIGQRRLQEIPLSLKLLKEKISPDFRNLPFDPNNAYVLPLAWGIMRELSQLENSKDHRTKPDKTTDSSHSDLIFRLEQLSNNGSQAKSAGTGRYKVNHLLWNSELGLKAKGNLRSELWILALSIDARSRLNKKMMTRFLETLFISKNQELYLRSAEQATPFLLAENIKIDPLMKPLFLRSIPLRELDWLRPAFQQNYRIKW